MGSHLKAFMKVKVKSLSRVQLFMTPWTVVYQAPLSMGFSRQEYWGGLPFPSPGESSQPRDWNQVSLIVGRGVTFWATREVLKAFTSQDNMEKMFFLWSTWILKGTWIQMFLNQPATQPRDIWQGLQTFFVVKVEKSSTGVYCVKVRNAAVHMMLSALLPNSDTHTLIHTKSHGSKC